MLGSGLDKVKSASRVREMLQDEGFVPLVRIGNAEHWVRDARRVVLAYEGAVSEAVPPLSLEFAYIVGDGASMRLSLA